MSESKQRLHPITILFNLITSIKHFYLPIIVGLITFRDQSLLYFSLIILGIILLLLSSSFLMWYRFTYQTTENELRIEHGVFIRKHRYISKNRIQSIDLTASVIHRLFKLVKVEVDTAGSGDGAEANLTAVKLSIGQQLRTDLMSQHTEDFDSEQSITESKEEPIFKISFKRLFLAGTTSGSAGVIIAIVLYGLSEVEQYIPRSFYDQTMEWIIGLSIAIIITLIIFCLLVIWIIGIAGTMIKYGKFTITRKTNELYITRGLFETREQTIPLNRIQAVGIKESIIRQPFGFVTVFAEVAGGSMDDKEEFNVLFPIMKKSEVTQFLQEILPDYSLLTEEVVPLPRRSLKFYLFRSIFPIIIVTFGLLYFLPQFSWFVIVLLLGFGALGILRYRDGGYRINNKQITIRYRGILSKVTVLLFKNRVQSLNKQQHKLQELQQLATLTISVIGVLGAGTHYTVKDMSEEDLEEVASWYSTRNKQGLDI